MNSKPNIRKIELIEFSYDVETKFGPSLTDTVAQVVEDIAEYFAIPVSDLITKEIDIDNGQWQTVLKFSKKGCGIIARFDPFVFNQMYNAIPVRISISKDTFADHIIDRCKYDLQETDSKTKN